MHDFELDLEIKQFHGTLRAKAVHRREVLSGIDQQATCQASSLSGRRDRLVATVAGTQSRNFGVHQNEIINGLWYLG